MDNSSRVFCLGSFAMRLIACSASAPSAAPPRAPELVPALSVASASPIVTEHVAGKDAPLPEPHGSSRVELTVEGHKSAIVWAPEGKGPRPLLVATHGAGGTPEHACDFWHALVGDRAFVLCPRGVTVDVYAPLDQRGYFYPAHPALEREVRAALAALDARFAARVDRAGAIYVGFSQGATMGALAFARAPGPFVAAALVEGGSDVWSLDSALAFRKGGGKRVVFVCGRAVCAEEARRSERLLGRAGVEVRVLDASGLPHAGHSLDGPVADGARDALAFLVGDDPRWASEPR